jgi:hypothetical protein
MTKDVYNGVGDFFRNLWGEYAGWAHSVRAWVSNLTVGSIHCRFASVQGLRHREWWHCDFEEYRRGGNSDKETIGRRGYAKL